MKVRNTTSLLVTAVAFALSGCAAQQSTSSASTMSGADMKQKQELSQLESQLKQTQRELAQTRNALASAESKPAAMPASSTDSSLFPPNPKPGQCYARVLVPAKYATKTERVLKREASERIEIVPARYEPRTEQVLIKEASSKLTVLPPTFETVTETVMVAPPSKKFIEVPAKYNTVTERILDKPAHTVWKRGSAALGTAANVMQTEVDEDTGEIMCLVEVPASYRSVTKQVLVSPPSTTQIEIPAKYETVKKQVVKTPATTREITIPAEYKTVTTTVMVSPPQERRIPIPAEYETVTLRDKVSDSKLEWRQVLCDVNLTADNVMKLQRALKDKGYYTGPIDGVVGPMTLGASNKYAKDKGLPSGQNYVAVEVAHSLGVKI